MMEIRAKTDVTVSAPCMCFFGSTQCVDEEVFVFFDANVNG